MIKEIIEIDGQKVPFKASQLFREFIESSSDVTSIVICTTLKRVSVRMTKITLTLIWYLWRYLRTSPI